MRLCSAYGLLYSMQYGLVIAIFHMQETTRFWPGLGGSESLYSWVLMAGGIGEIAFLPVIGYMAENIPYGVSQLVAGVMFTAGGTVYALASEGWMVMLGKALLGCAITSTVVVHTYIGEMGTRIDDMRSQEKKRPIKFALYIALSFILNGGYLVTFCKLFSENWRYYVFLCN